MNQKNSPTHEHGRKFNPDMYDADYFNGGTKSGYDDYDNAKGIVQDQHEIIESVMHPRLLETSKTPLALRMLDIGCAYGHGTAYWASKHYQANGLDISEYAIERAKELYGDVAEFQDGKATVEFDYWKLRNYGSKDRPEAPLFDVVVACELFEHIDTTEVFKVLLAMAQNAEWGVFCINARTNPFQDANSNDHDHGHLNNHFMQWWISKVGEFGIIDFDAMLEMSRRSQDTHADVHWHNRYIVVKFNKIKESK